MRAKRLPRWRFTDEEIAWLGDHAFTNELASDILYRYNLQYGKKLTRFSEYRYKLLHRHIWF